MGSVKVFLKKCVEIFRNMRCEDFIVYISAPNVSLCEKSIGYLKGSRQCFLDSFLIDFLPGRTHVSEKFFVYFSLTSQH